MEVNGAPKQPDYKLSSEYLPLCSAEQTHSYRFGTTWGWVNDDTIFIFKIQDFFICHIHDYIEYITSSEMWVFGWTIPLMGLK